MTQQPHATQPPTGGGQQPTGKQQQPTRDDTRQGMTPGRADYGYAPMPPETGWATGGAVFAGVLLLMNGVLAIFQGISALAEDDVWANIGDYVYKINLTGWGVILLVLGAVAVLAGAGILKGATWARMTGIFLASLNMIAQFLFLPYAPVWSLIMVGVNFFVIWALAVYRPAGTRT
ncbi:hypothetical protein [Streptomyces sp. V4I2]|uniref:DUF7144 family membrane protein n=1 Tax=Streptomyces sp. V4I2 TaxID=3042280 RepID=UPI0027890764|nr:hypothetical protein [Streptomyces sp. V4I2]MDQ1047157.1 lysylphosphatidylglycerol synthetase-like protein (DUF2156 family) [Streptomyces sp. V4I2]